MIIMTTSLFERLFKSKEEMDNFKYKHNTSIIETDSEIGDQNNLFYLSENIRKNNMEIPDEWILSNKSKNR